MILFDELSVSVADPILIKKTKMFLDWSDIHFSIIVHVSGWSDESKTVDKFNKGSKRRLKDDNSHEHSKESSSDSKYSIWKFLNFIKIFNTII
jgi:hypothetical protein